MKWSDVQKALCAKACGVPADIVSVTTDTRDLQSGDVFVALQGAHYNGEDFVGAALAQGAAAAVVTENFKDEGIPLDRVGLLKVPDTQRALGQLAHAWQSQYALKKVAITGSSGKTTVKELVASILSGYQPTLATQANFNNEIGVPLTLLRVTSQHVFAVLELGASRKGDIAYSNQWVQPQVAVLTNAGAAHLEGFGSLAGVAQAKGEIFAGVVAGGTAVINADDVFAADWCAQAQHLQQVRCSLNPDSGVEVVLEGRDRMSGHHSSDLTQLSIGYAAIGARPAGKLKVTTALQGEHNWRNILQAVAVGLVFECPDALIQAGIAAMRPVPGRLQEQAGWQQNIKLLNDSYNANPDSVKAAINVLVERPGQRLLVLGDMAELGDFSLEAHQQIGVLAREQGVDQLIAMGRYAPATLAGFGAGGIEVTSFEQAATHLKSLTRDLDVPQTVLLKGSRCAGVDKLVRLLTHQKDFS